MVHGTLEIAVIGGGGTIGRRIVDEALDRGHRVRVIVREAARVADGHGRRSVVQCDVLDPRLGEHLEGEDVVVSAVGSARAEDPDSSIYVRAAEALVGCLREFGASAPRLLVVGGVGSLRDESGALLLERVPEDRRPEHLGQRAALDFYRTVSDLHWTYVSPPARIAPGERTGAYRTGADELIVDANGESSISLEDYAVAVIDEAEDPLHERRRFTVAY